MSSLIRQLVYRAFSHLGRSEVQALDRACDSPGEAQEHKLKQILALNAKTSYGRLHGFEATSSYSDFKNAVPINTYEDLSPFVDRMSAGESNVLTSEPPFMFATTSGTSGKPKLIPVTEAYIREFRNASVVSGYRTLQAYPRISEGVTLSIFSPAQEGVTEGGIPYGAISGGLYLKEPALVKRVISPIPYAVYLTRDYESKYYTLLRVALGLPITVIYTLNPSTVMVLVRRLSAFKDRLIKDIRDGTLTSPVPPSPEVLAALSGFLRPNPELARRLSDLCSHDQFVPNRIWPQLQVVCCWTRAAASFYLADFPQYFGQLPVCDISYGASEGRGSVSLGDGRQLLSLRSHFFEFIPEDQLQSDINSSPTLMAHEVEEGKNYFILFTTSAGLYRYHINDVVKVVGKYRQAPLIEFQYKGGNVSSFTGEKVTELQVTEAMAAVARRLELHCRFFTLLGEFRPHPHYRLLVELEPPHGPTPAVSSMALIASRFDDLLGCLNIEYRSKRESGRLGPVEGALLEPGTYDELRASLTGSGVADAQIKVSHLNPKEEIRDYLVRQFHSGAGAGDSSMAAASAWRA